MLSRALWSPCLSEQFLLPVSRGVGAPHSGSQRVADRSNGLRGRSEHLKIPNPDGRPSSSIQFTVHSSIASYVSCDLTIPILAGSTRLMSRRMAMPKRAVHKYCDSQGRPGNVRPSRCSAVVATPATYACTVEGLSKVDLGRCVPLANRRHNASTVGGRSRVGHASSVPDEQDIRGNA